MITKEDFVDILGLHAQGLSQRQIAKKLGISRNTVKKHLKANSFPSYKPRPQMKGKLDPYKDYIFQRIQAAKPDWIPATVMFLELKSQGYDGGVTTVRSFLQTLKTHEIEPDNRFETPIGKQLQIDFTTIRSGKTKIKAFVATLGYSRACFVKFYTHEQAEAWQDGLISAFEYFGGVPEEVLCDNAKALVVERDAYAEGEHRWHQGMLNLAKDYGFKLKACQPYRARTKGKVERFNHYLKNSFVIPLRATLKQQNLELDITILNGKVGAWLNDVAHQRLHGTTKEQPIKRLIEEKKHLKPLPLLMNFTVERERLNIVPPVNFQHPISIYDELLVGL